MTDLAAAAEGFECLTCGHEFAPEGFGEAVTREVRDANGNLLQDGSSRTSFPEGSEQMLPAHKYLASSCMRLDTRSQPLR